MKKCSFCNKNKFLKKFEYFFPPQGETRYSLKLKKYHRFFLKCNYCHHWYSTLKFSLKDFYSSEYNRATYSGNLKRNFHTKIAFFYSILWFVGMFTSYWYGNEMFAVALGISANLEVFKSRPHE